MLHHYPQEIYKKPETPKTAQNEAFLRLHAALMAVGYTISLKPVNGVPVRLIEAAA
jgi:hypothetical protein